MQHEGSFHLDDIHHLRDDEAPRTVLGIKRLPQAALCQSESILLVGNFFRL